MSEDETRGRHAKPDQTQQEDVRVISEPGDAAPTAILADLPEIGEAPTARMPETPQMAAGAGAPYAEAAYGGMQPGAVSEAAGKKPKKRMAITLAVVLAVALAVYGGLAYYYSQHFFPRTTIGAYDVSDMTVPEAVNLLEDAAGDYTLHVQGDGLDFQITSEDTGLKIDSQKVVELAIGENKAWQWPYYLAAVSSQDLSDCMQATYDNERFETLVKGKVDELNANATDPVSATIAYDDGEKGFVIVPHQLGTKVDAGVVLEKAKAAAMLLEDDVELNEDELLRPPVLSDDERLAKAVTDADAMLGADFDLTLNGTTYRSVTPDLVASWITLDDQVNAVMSEDRMRDWAGELSHKLDTIGSRREYTTPRGQLFVVSGGIYGWQMDYDSFVNELIDAVRTHSTDSLEIPCTQTAAVPPDENNVDWGDRYIDVNLITQHAVFYDGGEVIWESDIISGSPDGTHATPVGVYVINLKESPSKLVGENVPVTVVQKDKNGKKTKTTEMQPEYETTVQYWMPFVGNAVGFHDATWQPDFGGDMYASGYGSHGCVNLPYDAAEQLYSLVTEGTPVISHQ